MRPINWKRVPFVRILLAFGLGLYLAAQGLALPLSYIRPLLLGLGLLLFPLAWQRYSYQWRWFFGASWFLWLLLFGQLRYQTAQEWAHPHHFRLQLQEQPQWLIGEVLNFPKTGKRQRVKLAVKALQDSSGHWKSVRGHSWAYFPLDSSAVLLPGTWLKLKSRLQPIAPPGNPFAFDYRAYSANQQVYHQAYVAADNWQIIPAPSLSWRKPLAEWRLQLLQVFEDCIPNTDAQAILSALTLGYKEDLSSEIRQAYAQSGAMHVLAVSGLHVGLVAGVFGLLLSRLRMRQRLKHRFRFVVLLLALWLFALLTGAAASVLRATCMFSFVLLGQLLRRPLNIYNSLAVSAFVLLCWSPNLLFEVGFQLSYSAVIGIITFQRDLQNCWYPRWRIVRAAWVLCTVSIAAQLGTLGFSLYYFHQFPSYFWLSGLIVIPLATVLLPMGLALLLLASVSPIRQLLSNLLQWLLELQNQLIALLGQLPYPVVEGFWLSPLGVLLLYACIFGIWYAAQQGWKRLWLPAALCFLWTAYSFNGKASQQQQVELCAFQIYKGYALSLVQGQSAWVQAEGDAQKMRYAQDNYFMALGIRERQQWPKQEGLLRIGDFRFAQFQAHRNSAVEVDALFLPQIQNVEEIWRCYQPKLLICAQRLSRKKLTQLKAACAEHNCRLHYIPTDGAWRKRWS